MKKINSILVSVYNKDGLEDLISLFKKHDTKVFSTGGTYNFLKENGLEPIKVEDITGFPSILDGRVKTLHPWVFAWILAKRQKSHLQQIEELDLPLIDMVIVDLYPFEDTVKNTNNESEIIEKIDIWWISLIRAAAKNYHDVLVVSSKDDYKKIYEILSKNNMKIDITTRKKFAKKAFATSMNYDTNIYKYFANEDIPLITKDIQYPIYLRYGENPHQKWVFFGKLDDILEKLNWKELSYNNLVDVDSAINIISEFKNDKPTFAILKHTNTCGLSTQNTISQAWDKALEWDPVSAFGWVLVSNSQIDLETAKKIDSIFYEVLIAPDFQKEALDFLSKKEKRILLKIKKYPKQKIIFKKVLNGVLLQDYDNLTENENDFKIVTNKKPTKQEIEDLIFANKIVKHLKSNAIVFVKNKQLIWMWCWQTSRVDACEQWIKKAQKLGFNLEQAVMASDAFFPFPDSIELAHKAGITSVIQPGGSIKDNLSIEYCNNNNLSMIFTWNRHFKH